MSSTLPDVRSRLSAPVRQFGGLRLKRHYVFGLTLIALVFSLSVPLYYLVATSLQGSNLSGGAVTHAITFRYFRAALTQANNGPIFLNTAEFALGSALGSTLLGLILAWLLSCTQIHGRRIAYIFAFVYIAVPGLLKVVGFILLYNNSNGFFWTPLRQWFHIGAFFPLYSMQGMILCQILLWLPITYILIEPTFENMDSSLEEAAAIHGVPTFWRSLRITLGLAFPNIFAAFLFSLVHGITSLEVPLFIGVRASIYTVSSQIYTSLQESLVPDYGYASALAIIIAIIAAALVFCYQRMTSVGRSYQTIRGKGYTKNRIRLGAWLWPASAGVIAVAIAAALPIFALFWASIFKRVIGPTQWRQAWDLLTLSQYAQVWHTPAIMQATVNSIIVASVSATLVCLLALSIAWHLERVKSVTARVADLLATVPLAIPGIVMGSAVLFAYVRLPLPIYGTIWLMVVAFVPLFLPFGVRYVHGGMISISRELEDSARVLGVSHRMVIARILVPLLKGPLLAAWFFTFLIAVRELDASILLYGPHSEVISTILFDYWNDGGTGTVAAFGLLVAAGAVVISGVAMKVLGKSPYRN